MNATTAQASTMPAERSRAKRSSRAGGLPLNEPVHIAQANSGNATTSGKRAPAARTAHSATIQPRDLPHSSTSAPILVEWLQHVQWPYVKPDTNGIALTFTSPALILAFLAKTPRNVVTALWITAALVAAPEFMYYLNGWVQFGMRHALDFLPYLFALMAIGVRDRLPRWGVALIIWSALVGAWGVWYWNSFIRTNT
jgi:hypothetical protein